MRVRLLSGTKSTARHQWCRLRKACRILLRAEKAVAIIETAFALPLILLIGLGGIELAHLVMTHSRLSQAALGVADNASRIGGATGVVREMDINEVFRGSELQTAGMNWAQHGRIILSSLEMKILKDRNGVETGTEQWVHWQRCMGGLQQGIQPMTADRATGMGPVGKKLKADRGNAIMFVEVFFDHSPMVMPNLFGTRRIHYTAAFSVREARDLDAGTNGVVQLGTASNC